MRACPGWLLLSVCHTRVCVLSPLWWCCLHPTHYSSRVHVWPISRTRMCVYSCVCTHSSLLIRCYSFIVCCSFNHLVCSCLCCCVVVSCVVVHSLFVVVLLFIHLCCCSLCCCVLFIIHLCLFFVSFCFVCLCLVCCCSFHLRSVRCLRSVRFIYIARVVSRHRFGRCLAAGLQALLSFAYST